MSSVVGDPLPPAHDAFQAHDWTRALDLFRKADRDSALAAEDLEAMANAAWWVANPDEAIDVWQRAYAAYLQVGKKARAGYIALTLAREYGVKAASSVSSSWFNRAKRLLDAEPESGEHGYLYLLEAVLALNTGNNEESIAAARRAQEVGGKVGDPNLQAIGAVYEGSALVEQGHVSEGLGLIDDAALAAVSGELGLFATGTVYCNTIATCCEIADFARARDWADAARRWSASHPFQPIIPGDCRVHEAEVLALRGHWAEAEESARRGAEELRAFNRLYHVGEALYQVGAIRLHVGDLESAADLFRQASDLGRDPHPGVALLLLREGKTDAAAASIRRALDEETSNLSRARLLPAFVEISVVLADLDAAQTSADELESIARIYGARSLQAAADSARGQVLLARGDDRSAARILRRAVAAWQEVEAPYEVARSRVILAQAIGRQGDQEGAMREAQAARAAFEKLGATFDMDRVQDVIAAGGAGHRAEAVEGLKTLMFTDIVKSTNLVEAIGDDAWLDLVGWHDQTLRALFSRYGGDEVDHAGDGFFVAFDDVQGAVACAVAIQRTLAAHRRAHGFAPQVRIGLHSTMASRTGRAYRGKGVHAAARIAALAEGGEIIASRATVDTLDGIAVSNERTATLKGITEPVEVVTVAWRA